MAYLSEETYRYDDEYTKFLERKIESLQLELDMARVAKRSPKELRRIHMRLAQFKRDLRAYLPTTLHEPYYGAYQGIPRLREK